MGLSLSPRSRKRMVHTVRDYLLNDLNNISCKTTQSISQQIVDTYKKSFTTKIANQSTDGQVESLRQSIYFAAHYLNGQSGDGNEKFDNLDDDLTIDKPKVQDEYGCVAYLPAQPKPDVLASLEEQRLKLIQIFKSKRDVDEEIIELMDACYYFQRKKIHTEKELSIIFEHCSYFHYSKLIIKHANQLLGKNINSIWKLSLKKLSKPINRYSKNGEIAREVTANKKKSKADADTEAESKYVRNTLKLAQQYSDNLKNDEPYEAVVFAFITKFMKENLNFLYVLTSEELTDEELLERVPVANPVLMIRGKDLHDSRNIYHIVINKSIMIYAPSFTEGILTTFLCYYVFSIVNPPEIEGTLEAIQRLFLEINPEKGTKRGGKRKGTKIHPKVSKLTKDIDPYIID
ncbi:uncharacterized protein LOC103579333 [Microplitis demolitor]|uniref:uncharacterized protein LOC103579333 n=1 Tax=Microplitis demolitor TaxID=69319 RepID=UPI00235B6724|nr:uncharacterized protein LOC103579333 [Microplitis demolitor]